MITGNGPPSAVALTDGVRRHVSKMTEDEARQLEQTRERRQRLGMLDGHRARRVPGHAARGIPDLHHQLAPVGRIVGEHFAARRVAE